MLCPLFDSTITFTDVKLWDILAEVVTLSLQPPPSNPFAINHAYFDGLPLEESIVLVGAMIDFLQKVYLKNYPFEAQGERRFCNSTGVDSYRIFSLGRHLATSETPLF
jgi:hypothetical protein